MPPIAFNGKTYNSLEEMPAAERQAYSQIMTIFADANQNGVPDIFEGNLMKNMMSFAGSTMVVHGNQSYTLDGMPPEVRAKYEEAMKKLQTLGLMPKGAAFGWTIPPVQVSNAGTGGVLESGPKTTTPIAPSTPMGTSSFAQEDKGPNILGIVAAIVVLFLVCGAAAVVLFMLSNR